MITKDEAINRLIKHALKDVGTKESPKGSNCGTRVEQMLRTTGLGKGYPWCAAACATWLRETFPRDKVFCLSADCDTWLAKAKKAGVLHSTGKKGDFGLVMRSESDATHIFLVIDDDDSTVEGNTNAQGSREGDQCAKRNRSQNGKYKYIRWVDAPWVTFDGITGDAPRDLQAPAFKVTIKKNVPTESGEKKLFSSLFPKVLEKDGRPIVPTKMFVQAVLGISLEATEPYIGWDGESKSVSVRKTPLQTFVMENEGVFTAYTFVRETAEALGYNVTYDPTTGVAVEPYKKPSA